MPGEPPLAGSQAPGQRPAVPAAAPGARRPRWPRALRATTWLRRNPRTVLLLLGVQALVTSLFVLVVTPTNAFRATSEIYARTLDAFTIVAPRSRPILDDHLSALLDANPAQAGRVPAKMFWLRTPMIIGEGYAPLLALAPAAREEFLARVGVRLGQGRLPAPGAREAAVHETVLRARGLALGDSFGQDVAREEPIPGRFEVVGVLKGDARLGLVDLDYTSQPESVFSRRPVVELVWAQEGHKAKSDAYLHAALDQDGVPAFRVVDAAFARAEIERLMENLPLVVGFITGAVALVVAWIVSLLSVIAFHMRRDEFALHLALGHPRSRLAARLARETLCISAAAWALGLCLGWAGVSIYSSGWLEPKGIVVDLVDPSAVLFALFVPFFSTIGATLALGVQLGRMDPVAVLQRRGT